MMIFHSVHAAPISRKEGVLSWLTDPSGKEDHQVLNTTWMLDGIPSPS
jgi:hypothetical protein